MAKAKSVSRETVTHVPVERLRPNPWGLEVGPPIPPRITGIEGKHRTQRHSNSLNRLATGRTAGRPLGGATVSGLPGN